MKKIYLLALPALLLSAPLFAVEHDSVYTWGQWAKGIKPAAGPVVGVTPPPAQKTDINFRPNENDAFLREAIANFQPAPPAAPGAPQVPDIVIAPTETVTTPGDRF